MFSVLDISKKTYYRYRNSEDKDYYDYLLIKKYLGITIKKSTIYRYMKLNNIQSITNIEPIDILNYNIIKYQIY